MVDATSTRALGPPRGRPWPPAGDPHARRPGDREDDNMLGRRGLGGMIAGELALSAMALGCGKKSEGSGGDPAKHAKDDPEWKVGAYFSLSGEETAFGVDSKEGIDLAMDEINNAGGVKG